MYLISREEMLLQRNFIYPALTYVFKSSDQSSACTRGPMHVQKPILALALNIITRTHIPEVFNVTTSF